MNTKYLFHSYVYFTSNFKVVFDERKEDQDKYFV